MNLLQFLKPTNIATEQEKFFSSSVYNPTFTYNWDKNAIDEWLAQPSQKKYTSLAEAILCQEPNRIVQAAKEVFSTDIEPHLLEKAKEVMLQPRVPLQNQSIESLVSTGEEIFKHFGISYKIILSEERGFNIRPSHSKEQLIINKYLNLNYFSCAGLIRHEVTHIVREMNAHFNRIEKSDNYLPTEEGLASYLQYYKGHEENYSLYQHAARYVATQVALEGSFRNVVDFLCDNGFEKKLAFRRAIRHKMGFIDSSKPGDIMKSSMYFCNLHRVQQLSNEEILRLFVGKIAIQDLSKYPTYKGKIDESRLREYYEL